MRRRICMEDAVGIALGVLFWLLVFYAIAQHGLGVTFQ